MSGPDRGSSTASGLLGLLCCLLGVAALSVVTPEFGYESRYRYSEVAVGELGRLREYDAGVTGVRLARTLQTSSEPLISAGAWVIVQVTADVRLDGQTFNAMELRTRDGRTYDPRPEWFSSRPSIVDPGFSTAGTLVFELPPDQVPGAELVIGPDAGEVTTYDAAVRVDLGLSDITPVAADGPELSDPTVWVT